MAFQTIRDWLTKPKPYIVPVSSVTFPQAQNPVVPRGPLTASQKTAMWQPNAAQALAANQPSSVFFAPANGIVHV